MIYFSKNIVFKMHWPYCVLYFLTTFLIPKLLELTLVNMYLNLVIYIMYIYSRRDYSVPCSLGQWSIYTIGSGWTTAHELPRLASVYVASSIPYIYI